MIELITAIFFSSVFFAIGFAIGHDRGVGAASELADKCYASDIATAIRELA